MTDNEYKELIKGLFTGLLLAGDGSSESGISSMYGRRIPNKNGGNSGQFVGVNSGLSRSVPLIGPTGSTGELENGSGSVPGLTGPTSPSSVLDMVTSSGGTSKTNNQTRWIFIANPNCCPKCLGMNGKIEVGPEEPKFYGHVPDRDGRFNCRCHWVRMS